MPTTPLLRRAGARTARSRGAHRRGDPLTGAPTAGAVPMAPGDNGTVKIHSAPYDGVERTPFGDPRPTSPTGRCTAPAAAPSCG